MIFMVTNYKILSRASFHSFFHRKPKMASLFPFYRRGRGGSGLSIDFPKFPQPISGQIGTGTCGLFYPI